MQQTGPNLTGTLTGVDSTSTSYYAQLTTMSSTNDPTASSFINTLLNLNLPWINTWLVNNGITSGSSVGGLYYQLTSQIPGKGPCNGVYVPTVSYLNRQGRQTDLV